VTTVKEAPTKFYTVSGNNLPSLHKSVLREAQRSGLGNQPGRTKWIESLDNSRPNAPRVNVGIGVTLPKLSDHSKLSAAAKAEWNRFLERLKAHEQGHIDLVRKHLGGLAESMPGSRRQQRDAFRSAERELKKASAAYDKQTRHGATQGALLDTSIR